MKGAANVGDVVSIRTKAGKTWDARVTRVLWTGEGVTLCATEGLDRPRTTRHSGRARMGSGHGQAANVPGYSGYCTDNEYCRCYDCAS